MPNVYDLIPGSEEPTVSDIELETRVADLQATVKHYLPEYAEAVNLCADKEVKCVVLHQDAFAAAFAYDEYTLMEMAAKYAGLYNVNVWITGKAK